MRIKQKNTTMKTLLFPCIVLLFLSSCITTTQLHYSDPNYLESDQFSTYEEIAEYKVEKNYLLDKPKGVRGRSSDNAFIKEKLNWSPSITLKKGLEKTYKWIFNEIAKKESNSKFTKY